MKNKGKKLTVILLAAVIIGIYYYVTLPAINIHSAGFWQCLLFLIAVFTISYALAQTRKEVKNSGFDPGQFRIRELFSGSKTVKAGVLLFIAVALVYFVGAVLSSPIVNASK